MENVEQWLNSPPLETEIKTKDKGKYIPYAIIVEKLNKLCGHEWSTKNFKESYYKHGTHWFISGSIDVEVLYKPFYTDHIIDMAHDKSFGVITRTLSGAASYLILKGAANQHHSATVKSLAIMNAVKPLGKQFGWQLNPENEEESVTNIPEKKEKPDQEKETLMVLIENADTKAKLLTYQILAKSKGIMTQYNKKLKQLTNG